MGRLLLQHAVELAPIVFPQLRPEIGRSVIEGLANFWIAIQCGYVLNPEKFNEFALHVDNLLRTYVDWHPGVPAVHLDLIHGAQLMQHFFPIPLGKCAMFILKLLT